MRRRANHKCSQYFARLQFQCRSRNERGRAITGVTSNAELLSKPRYNGSSLISDASQPAWFVLV